MAFTDAQMARIEAAVRARITGSTRCPLCGHNTWNIGRDLAQVPIQRLFPDVLGPPRNYPGIALICQVCGNTHFLNALVLELDDLVSGSGR